MISSPSEISSWPSIRTRSSSLSRRTPTSPSSVPAACTSVGSRFVFTHAKPGYRKLVAFLTSLFAEPWLSAVESEDLPEYVQGTGWKIISDVDTDEAHGVERYAVAERR